VKLWLRFKMNYCITDSMEYSSSSESNSTYYQIIKKSTLFMEPVFTSAFTGARHLYLFCIMQIEFTLFKSVSLRFILILSSHLHSGLLNVFFISGFPTKILSCFSFPYTSDIPRQSPRPWFDHANNICWNVQNMKILALDSNLKT
jgi:hypothetical protein